MSEQQLAIASVPIQEWGEIYDDEEALQTGTIFKALNKPFFAAPSTEKEVRDKTSELLLGKKTKEQEEREDLLRRITRAGFVLDDLTLYLDTHESDAQAKALFHEKLTELNGLRTQFAEQYYPLSRCHVTDCNCPQEERFCWQTGPMPWEGACV